MKYKGFVLLAFLVLGNINIDSANYENKKMEVGIINFIGQVVKKMLILKL